MSNLYLVATPIGNLGDMGPRALKILQSVDILLCEDTRKTGLLVHPHPKLVSYYEEVEDKRIPEVISWLLEGKQIALISDAGTPLVSDPGYRLVRECVKRGIPVVSVPGPSALLAALTGSGLPPDKFLFLGFFREQNLNYVQPGITTIFYSAPHKLHRDLDAIRQKLGDIDIVLARELTKVHEEMWHGSITDALTHFADPKGEFVLLFNIPQA